LLSTRSTNEKTNRDIVNKNEKNRLSIVLTRLMNECELDDVKLSKHTNIPITTISRLRNLKDSNPTASTLRPIAQFFNVTIDQLLGDHPLPIDRLPGTHNPINYTSSLIPVLEWKDIICFLKNQHGFMKGKLLQWISSEHSFSENAFALTIPNDNFSLFLKNGSQILIEPEKGLKDGELGIFATDIKMITIYQILIDGNDIYIKSINPEIKSIKLLPENFIFLGSIIEVRFLLNQAKGNQTSELIKAKRLVPIKAT